MCFLPFSGLPKCSTIFLIFSHKVLYSCVFLTETDPAEVMGCFFEKMVSCMFALVVVIELLHWLNAKQTVCNLWSESISPVRKKMSSGSF